VIIAGFGSNNPNLRAWRVIGRSIPLRWGCQAELTPKYSSETPSTHDIGGTMFWLQICQPLLYSETRYWFEPVYYLKLIGWFLVCVTFNDQEREREMYKWQKNVCARFGVVLLVVISCYRRCRKMYMFASSYILPVYTAIVASIVIARAWTRPGIFWCLSICLHSGSVRLRNSDGRRKSNLLHIDIQIKKCNVLHSVFRIPPTRGLPIHFFHFGHVRLFSIFSCCNWHN
jgi:hypothetical protein